MTSAAGTRITPGFARERARLVARAGGHCEAPACGEAIGDVRNAHVVTLNGGKRAVFCAGCRERTDGHRVRDTWRGRR